MMTSKRILIFVVAIIELAKSANSQIATANKVDRVLSKIFLNKEQSSLKSFPVCDCLKNQTVKTFLQQNTTNFNVTNRRLKAYLTGNSSELDTTDESYPNSSTDSNGATNSDYGDEQLLGQSNAARLQVFHSFLAEQVVDVNEKEQMVTVKVGMRREWRDCRFSWDAGNFSVSSIQLDNDDKYNFYEPKQTLLEEIGRKSAQGSSRTTIASSGIVTTHDEYISQVTCTIDVSMYPFDVQVCNFTFQSVSNSYDVELVPSGRELTTSIKKAFSTTWEFAQLSAIKTSHCVCDRCDAPEAVYCTFDRLTYSLVLRRYPRYQFVNLMVPAFIITLLSSAVFLLPQSQYDKLSPSLAILVSLFVFTQVTYQNMPETGSTLPLISSFYLCCIILVSISCFYSILSARFYANLQSNLIASDSNVSGTNDAKDVNVEFPIKTSGKTKRHYYGFLSAKFCQLALFNRLLSMDTIFFGLHFATTLTVAIIFTITGFTNRSSFSSFYA